jgi:PAS domain S-box-containing protein
LALLGNFVIAAAYAAITVAVVVPVVRAGQLRTNRLAIATALIFFSCSVGHGFHTVASWQVIMGAAPMGGMHVASSGWQWPAAVWDLFTAGVGLYYWTLRRGYGVLLSSGGLYVDPGQQRLLDEVTVREQLAAQRVERHRAALAAAVEQSDDAITGTTLDGVVNAWNAGARRMFGYTAAEAVGVPAASLLNDCSLGLDSLTARIAAGERGIRYEGQVRHRDGSIIDVAVAISPVVNDNGVVVGASRVSRDISATKRAEANQLAAEERARHVEHMASLGQLAGGVAHDFNNLLGIILNFTGFAAEQAADDESIQADLTQVRSAAERAVGLARQLLTFTRQDTIRPENLDVNVSIAEAQAMLARTIGEHIELIAVPSPTPIMIYADAGHIQQILVNLAVNARDAMPDGGTLVIEATAVDLDEDQPNLRPAPTGGRYVRLLVSDTGTGISPDVIAHIFEPFYTTKPQGQGTGLGLATVYGIITDAGGSINVYSEPGIGTTFRVYFPIVDTAHRSAPTQPDTATAPQGHGQAILVVEDEPALALAVVRILDGAGYRTLSANAGAQALALYAEHGCDLLLTDVVMPGMSGRRLAELLRQRHPDLPVLYMSGYTNGLLGAARILDQGIAFIEKPFTARLLLTEVGDVFATARTELPRSTIETTRNRRG